MEFWGVEVKAGESLKVQPEIGQLIHISQAALGEVKDVKGAKYVPLRLKIDGKSFVMGSLTAEERPQLMCDMVFEKEFELSHDWKNGSVFFIGYTAEDQVSDGEEFSDVSEDESEDELVGAPANGHVKAKPEDVKAAQTAAAEAVAAFKAEAKKAEQPGSDEDEDGSDSDSDDELALGEDSSDDSMEDSEGEMDGSSSEEELPKVQQSKKRPAESPKPTPPVAAKKAKSDNKPGVTFPSKAAVKSPMSNNKSKGQSPKSGGQFSQKSGNKSFNSKGKRGGKF